MFRTLLLATLAALALLIPFGTTQAGEKQKQPPKSNVLFVVFDDLKPTIGAFGDPIARTPALDRVAASGTMFWRAYSMQAVCSPSRNAVLTGLRPEALRIYDLTTNFREGAPDVVTLPQLFKYNGWQAEGLGKIFHFDTGNHEDPDSWSVPFLAPPTVYALPENKELARAQKKAAKEGTQKGSKRLTPAMESADVPDNAYVDGQLADEAIVRLRSFKEKQQPFFLAVGFRKPHLPFSAPKKYWDLYDPAAFKLADRDVPPEGAPAYAGTKSGELHNYGDMPDTGAIPPAQARRLIHGYYAATSYADAQLGRILDELEALGLRENTVIVVWGDHGWHLGDHGMWCKQTNYEQAVHAPLIISAPGVGKPGSVSRSIVEFVDIYPTICELTGVARPSWLQGHSLKPLMKDPEATVGSSAAFHVYPRSTPELGRMLGQCVRTERYRLVEWQKEDGSAAARELYDYETDPGETVNLADRPEHKKTVAKLSAMIKKRLKASKPKGVTLTDPMLGPTAVKRGGRPHAPEEKVEEGAGE